VKCVRVPSGCVETKVRGMALMPPWKQAYIGGGGTDETCAHKQNHLTQP
jgi:hypothetical protein